MAKATWIRVAPEGDDREELVYAKSVRGIKRNLANDVLVRLEGEPKWYVAHDIDGEPITELGPLMETLDLSNSV